MPKTKVLPPGTPTPKSGQYGKKPGGGEVTSTKGKPPAASTQERDKV